MSRMQSCRVEHIGLWVRDLERMRQFYVERLGGTSSAPYANRRTGFQSCFISFGEGVRIELMTRRDLLGSGASPVAPGYGHVALGLADSSAVDEAVIELEGAGVVVVSRPRTTGDGYYEAVVEDPEGNRIELVGARRSRTSG